MRRLRDRRVWLALGVTAVALWFAFRDVSWPALAEPLARADWTLLLGASLPAYLGSVWLRAARWRVLARGVADVPTGAAFRASAVGFLVNNVLPLRVGELVRGWWLGREIGASIPALLGTLVLERVIDAVCLLGLAALVIGPEVGRGWLLALAAAPLAATLALRRWPGPVLGGIGRAARGLLAPARAERVVGVAGAVARGLAGLRGAGDVGRVLLQTLLLWAVAAVVPFWAALEALDIDVGDGLAPIHAALLVLVYVAAAVALPAAPGFFGPYHAACRYALTPLGVPKEEALALGTLAHAVFWLATTAIGLFALRGGTGRLREAFRASEAEPAAPTPVGSPQDGSSPGR